MELKWQRTRNILAFPYGWQRPAKTEEWAYESWLSALPYSPFVQMVCFPWATVIDLLRKDKAEAAQLYLSVLRWIEPKSTLRRATVCQHIYAKDMWPFFKRLKITDVFWSHARKSEFVHEGIRIHPFPLYPVRFIDRALAVEHKPLVHRKFLYAFIGTYQSGLYERETRKWIFELPARDDACVERRQEWHYERHVYGEQVCEMEITDIEKARYKEHSDEYEKVMKETIFSLCPSGSGPNSIRLWESLGFGCIPVVLSDDYQPPASDAIWREAVLIVNETSIDVISLPETLAGIIRDSDRIESMLKAGRELWRSSIENCQITHVVETLTANLSDGGTGGQT